MFCGSAPGTRPRYQDAAKRFGAGAAERGIALVYGGARAGMMGAMANAALAGGAEVVGVIPRWFKRDEISHDGLSKTVLTDTMAERKAAMADLADAFVALPGGVGTLDELFEMITNSTLDLHDKPCALLNTASYYDSLLEFMERGMDSGFIRGHVVDELIVESDPTALLDRLAAQLAR